MDELDHMYAVPAESNIAYLGQSRSERMDLYRPSGSPVPLPVVIYVDGGAFHSGGRSSNRSRVFSGLMSRAGYAVLALDYALSRSRSGAERWSAWPRNLLDIAAAVDFATKHSRELQLDRNRIALVGASAGATLALLADFGAAEAQGAAETAKHIRGVVNFYGRVDWLSNTVAEKQPPSRETALAASPTHWIERSAHAPGVLTLHGDRDDVVPIEQARLLDASLHRRGLPHELHELEGLGHSFGLEPESAPIETLLLDLLGRTLENTEDTNL